MTQKRRRLSSRFNLKSTRLITKAISKTLPDSDLLRSLLYWPMFEMWRRHHSRNYPVFHHRNELFDYISREIVSNSPIQYLEFGVWKGQSIKYFAKTNTHTDSRFIGFDTFTGLSENWLKGFSTVNLKHCDAGGELPQSDDTRLSFVKGLFQDTLPDFLETYRATGKLVIHNDSDLYSSTLYVLTRASDIILPGTIIIFDEFWSVMHEFRALLDYCSSYNRRYDIVAATRNYVRVAIRMR